MIKRKKYLINPDFQISFIKLIMILLIIVIGIFYGANTLLFWTFAEKGRVLGLEPNHVFFSFLMEQRNTMDMIFIWTTLVTTIVVISYGLFLSNRVAGPVHRLKVFLDEYKANNNQSPLKFRKKDYFPELAESINEALKLK